MKCKQLQVPVENDFLFEDELLLLFIRINIIIVIVIVAFAKTRFKMLFNILLYVFFII